MAERKENSFIRTEPEWIAAGSSGTLSQTENETVSSALISGVDTGVREIIFADGTAASRFLHQHLTHGSQSMDSRVDTSDVVYMKEGCPRIVFANGSLRRISHIDGRNECFNAVMLIDLTWLMTEKEVRESQNAMDKWVPQWSPQLYCENMLDGCIEKTSGFQCILGSQLFDEDSSKDIVDLGFDPKNAFWCRVQWRCDLKCIGLFDLRSFPFDCQDLAIHLKLIIKESWMSTDVCLLPFPSPMKPILSLDAPFSVIKGWIIHGVYLEMIANNNSNNHNNHNNEMITRIKAERNAHIYENDFLWMDLLYWMGVGMFAIPLDDIRDRLIYCIVLFLTMIVTLKMTKQSFYSCLILSYDDHTFFDDYCFCCIGFVMMLAFYVLIFEDYFGTLFDKVCFYIAIVIALMIEVLLYWEKNKIKNKEHSKLQMNGDELSMFYDNLNHEKDRLNSVPYSTVNWDPHQSSSLNHSSFSSWISRSVPWKE